MLRHILCTSLVIVGCTSFPIFAEYEKQVDTSWTTNIVESLDFSTEYVDGKVDISWNTSSISLENGEYWQYWKLLRSQKTDNPLYPEIGALKVSDDRGFSSYTDSYPPVGTNYYRVCAITKKTNNIRYCSQVKKIIVEHEISDNKKIYAYEKQKMTNDVKKEYTGKKEIRDNSPKKIVTDVSNPMKIRIQSMIETFMKKLDKKYSSPEEKIAHLEKILSRIETATASIQSEKTVRIFKYFSSLIEEYIVIYTLEETLS